MVIKISSQIGEGNLKKVIMAHLFLLALSACLPSAGPTPAVPQAPTQVAAVTPIPSALPPSSTAESQFNAEWQGIPIMPGAIAGEGDEDGYVFTIQATPQQVQEYYQLELGKLGWQTSAQENSGSSLILSFLDGASATLTVSILSKGDQVLVLLVK
jgi:hypothetical protein